MFSIKYQKGCDNATTDALSHVTSKLNAETVKSILDGVTMGITRKGMMLMTWQWLEAEEEKHKPFQETADSGSSCMCRPTCD